MCQPLSLKYFMLTQIDCIEPIDNIQYQTLNYDTKKVATTFDLPSRWCKVTIPCARQKIKSIKIGDVDIKHILNSGYQYQDTYTIWLHGDLDVLMERVFDCFDQDDLLKWKNLREKYLATESFNEETPSYLPSHIRNFYARGQGPYWWKKNSVHLPYRQTNIPYDSKKLLGSLDKDLVFKDQKFYKDADCKSLQKNPELPLTPVVALKDDTLKKFLTDAGFVSILQIQYVEMQPHSHIDLHRDDFDNSSGLIYMQGASQLYCVLKGDPKKFKMRFSKAGTIDLSKPVFINNNSFVHSLHYNGDDVRGALLVYGNS